MVDAIGSGDWRGAANKAMTLLLGNENPFQNAAQSVIQTYVKHAAAKPSDVAAEIPGASGLAKYVSDVKAGNTSGAIGDVVGTAAGVAPMLLGDEATRTKAGEVVSDAASKAKNLASEDAASQVNQPQAQSAIREATSDVNRNLRVTEGVAPEPSASIRDSVQDVANAVKARSKIAFQTLDEASGGRWQRFDDQLSNLRDKANEVAGIDDDQYDKLTQKANDIEAAQNDLINSLVKDGKISPGSRRERNHGLQASFGA
jgi:hypothetical protein